MGGLRIMGYLPSKWTGKRVQVAVASAAVLGVVGTLVSENAGGLLLEVGVDPPPPTPLTAFIPWTAIIYVHLFEDTESTRSLPVTEMPLG
jgi:hypothetical protein